MKGKKIEFWFLFGKIESFETRKKSLTCSSTEFLLVSISFDVFMTQGKRRYVLPFELRKLTALPASDSLVSWDELSLRGGMDSDQMTGFF